MNVKTGVISSTILLTSLLAGGGGGVGQPVAGERPPFTD